MTFNNTQHMNYYYQKTVVANISRYFNEKKALSADKAVSMTLVDWVSLGVESVNPASAYSFVEITSDGKFWLNSEKLAKEVQLSNLWNKVMWGIVVVIFLAVLAIIIYSVMLPLIMNATPIKY